MANDYKSTLHMPKTAFPMRGNLGQNEPKMQEEWDNQDLYNLRLKKNEGNTEYVLHDGPPYANGDIHIGHALNKTLKDFWLVDPIDGTYDYINNLEEFTINAGLIINNKPAAGLIYAPAKKRMFYSFGKGNAFELCDGKTINLSEKNIKSRPIKFVSYSNKIKPEIQKIYQEVGVLENIKMKSSLKFCVVAAGDYDGYVAEPRAYEWDIAAGHAILEHSGGTVTDFDGNEILYGKKDLKNPSLILKSRNLING